MITAHQTRSHCANKQGSSRPVLLAVGQLRPHHRARAVQQLVRAAADDSMGGDPLDEPFLNKLDMGVVFSQQNSKFLPAG